MPSNSKRSCGKEKWATDEEVIDYAIGQSTPGIIAVIQQPYRL